MFVPQSIIKTYLPADTVQYFNQDDPHLDTIAVRLPECPPLEEIDNYGLPAEKQFFKRPSIPVKLQGIESRFDSLDAIYEHIALNKSEYKDEIQWIKKQWDRRINGYWVFINGKPTYIDGWHFLYSGFWRIDIGYPEYRDRDRRFFLFARFCYSDTTLPDGTDIGSRVCLGFTYAKHRREGATYKAGVINFDLATGYLDAQGGIQSQTGPDANRIFKKAVVKPWSTLPFFFKPLYSGTTDPAAELNFRSPAQRMGGGGSLLGNNNGLRSQINHAQNAKRDFYDGEKLVYYHGDEVGKTMEEDVEERHRVVRRCVGEGSDIGGLMVYTSTVGEMNKKGGYAFWKLVKQSHYGERNDVGMTKSGLYNYFVSASDGLQGFIDRYGNSVVEDPDERQIRAMDPKKLRKDRYGKIMGAKRYLQSNRDAYLEMDDDPEVLMALEEEIRLHPLYFNECFITSSAGTGFNLRILNKRIRELQFPPLVNTATVRGKFDWSNGFGSRVTFYEDASGPFVLSKVLSEHESNRRYKKRIITHDGPKEVWFPDNQDSFVASADPMLFARTEKSRISKGGGAVFWKRDYMIDPDDKPIDSWDSHRFVCDYLYRPITKELYAEDMLKMCVYYGAMIYPEINVPLIWDKFVEWGYDGYLLYGKTADGYRKTPGFNSREDLKQVMFGEMRSYVQNHGHRDRHINLQIQIKEIKSTEEMKDYDLFTAACGCLIALKSDWGEAIKQRGVRNEGKSIDFFIPKRK